MTATTLTSTATTDTTARRPLAKAGVAAAVVASVATVTVASLAHAAGVSLDIAGEQIPLLGFANLTFVLSLVGLAIASVMTRRAAHPRSLFLRTTAALLLLSFVPDLSADAAVSTKLTLMLTHVVAAAIVVPVLARRLAP
jgi:hypothetical protein